MVADARAWTAARLVAAAKPGWPPFRRSGDWSHPNGHKLACRRFPAYDPETDPYRSDMRRRGVQQSMSRRRLYGTDVGRNDRDRDVRLVLRVPQ